LELAAELLKLRSKVIVTGCDPAKLERSLRNNRRYCRQITTAQLIAKIEALTSGEAFQKRGIMNLLSIIVLYGLPCSLVLSALILAMALRNPRFLLQDYPRDIQAAVPPKTQAERRASAYWAAIFFLVLLAFPIAAALSTKASHGDFLSIFLSVFGVSFLFNIVDWLILDLLIVCTITPRFVIIPGTEGMAGYKNYAMHFRGFLIGTIFSISLGLIVAATLTYLG
jgi:hypothetical protein